MKSPLSATRIEPKPFGLWRVTRSHECSDHRAGDRKWFFRRESAARHAKVWMDYRWVYCWNTWSGNHTH